MFNEGFGENKSKNEKIPPGQYLEKSFPVLSAGPTVHIDKESWDFSIIENEEIIFKISWKDLKDFPKKEINSFRLYSLRSLMLIDCYFSSKVK